MATKVRYNKNERQEIRDDITVLRERIRAALFEKHAIPRGIVSGTLSQVREYKDSCEAIRTDNFVRNHPGDSLSGSELLAVKSRLENYVAKIHA